MFVKRDHKKFGRFLREQRLKLKMSQPQIARVVGCHTQFISNIERGICAPPLKVLKVLTKLYKLSPNELIRRIINEQKNYLKKNLTK